MTYDAIVLGAGPAGLGAALELARAGAKVAVLEAGDQVGGLCRTVRRRGLAYDVGGHILFVNDEERRQWLDDLLGADAIWVDKPVVCWRDGHLRRGRYLDQRPDGPVPPGDAGPSARDVLAASLGGPFVDGVIRRYLEKVDGMPLERITAQRAQKLWVEQSAPTGFWYAAGGIGQLMDTMADHVRLAGGVVLCATRVTRIRTEDDATVGVDADGPGGPIRLESNRVIAGLPGPLVARLIDPPAPVGVVPSLPPRAAALVYLHLRQERVTEHAWIQIDDARVPFARLAETRNWSEAMIPQGETVLGCEVYCDPVGGDRWWERDDAALGRACADALARPLGLIDDPAGVELLEVIRLPHAWSLVDVDALEAAAHPYHWLTRFAGLRVAQGGDVIRAIAAGEEAARES